MSKKNYLDGLINLIAEGEKQNNYYSDQNEIKEKLEISQSYVSKLINAAMAQGKVVKDGKYYRLSITKQKERHKLFLEKTFSEYNGSVCEISQYTLAVKVDLNIYSELRNAISGFFGEFIFGTFFAENMIIVILNQSCNKKLVTEFKQIVIGNKVGSSSR